VIAITGRSYRLRNRAADSTEAPAVSKPANAPIPAAGSETRQAIENKPNTASPKRRKTAAQSAGFEAPITGGF
jgi:hypothetical protein